MADYLRQKTIPLSALPAHPRLPQSSSGSRPTVHEFVRALRQQSAQLIDGVCSPGGPGQQGPWKSLGKKKEADMYDTDLDGEYWTCRRSVHENASDGDSFTWSEIYHCIYLRHFECEQEWAPTLKSFEKLLVWDEAAAIASPDLSKVELSIFALRHDVSSILKDRLFPIVLLKAQTRPDEFIVTSLALSADDYKSVKGIATKEKVVVGRYNSVERVRLIPPIGRAEAGPTSSDDGGPVRPTHTRQRLPSSVDPTSDDRTHDERSPSPVLERSQLDSKSREIEMMMAVNSDAGGNIPNFAQKRALPGSVAVDVGAIRQYLINERLKNKTSGKGNFSNVEWSNGNHP